MNHEGLLFGLKANLVLMLRLWAVERVLAFERLYLRAFHHQEVIGKPCRVVRSLSCTLLNSVGQHRQGISLLLDYDRVFHCLNSLRVDDDIKMGAEVLEFRRLGVVDGHI